MENILHSQELAHHFLIATPDQDDDALERRIVYLVDDDPQEGATGFIINEPAPVTLREVMENLDIPILHSHLYLDEPALYGGPENPEHGFILYRPGHESDGGIEAGADCRLNTSRSMLEKMGRGHFPQQMLVLLGSIHWPPGMLQQALRENRWLIAPYNRTLLFEAPYEIRWEMALNQLGVRPDMLSSEYGRA